MLTPLPALVHGRYVLFSVTPAIPKMDDNKDKKADKKSAKHKSSGHHKKKSKRDDKLRKAFAGPTKIDINEIELGPKLVRLRISLPLYSKLSLDIYIYILPGRCVLSQLICDVTLRYSQLFRTINSR